jgi:hypothetical protein
MPNTPALSHDILNAALAGLEAEKKKLDAQIARCKLSLGLRQNDVAGRRRMCCRCR